MLFCSNPASLSSPELLSSTPRGCWSVARCLGWWSASRFVTFSPLPLGVLLPLICSATSSSTNTSQNCALFARSPAVVIFIFYFTAAARSRTHTFHLLSIYAHAHLGAHAKVLAGWLAGERKRTPPPAGSAACMTVVLQMRACIFHDRSNSAVGF
jgi:hypothetical protein